ncbi:MAG: S9 family peptidase [Aureispira sp.]|nr:S9 family peptidase [Aureispira sp.]
MMKKIILLALFILPFAMNGWAQEKESITIKHLWEDWSFYPSYVPGFNFMKDGKHYSVMGKVEENKRGIVQFDIVSGKEAGAIFSTDEIAFSSYSFSDDEQKIMLETASEKIYRYSTRANYYVWDRKGEKLSPVSEGGKQRYASFDSKATKVAFVRGNNLYYTDLATNKEVQVTKDGEVNKIINGATDWVYEEEFAIDKAFEWSPDGKKIAFLRFDESEVKEFTMTYYTGELYPKLSTFKYPKAGEKNSIVTVHIYDLEKKEIKKVNIKDKEEHYIPRINWTPDNQLLVTHLNRHQNHLTLYLANPKNGKAKSMLTEKNEYFIDITNNLRFLKNKQFIWTSDQDGYSHIYLYNMKGKKVRQLTKGEFDVIEFYGIDEESGRLYFQAAVEGAMNRGVYWVTLESDELHALHTEKGVNSAQFSSTFQYYVNTHSHATSPPHFKVYETEGNKLVRTIEENNSLKERLTKYNMGTMEFFKFKNTDDVELNGWMIKPSNFDPSKKYPVFMYVYGGPGRQTVMNEWGGSNYMWFQMLAEKGYIVVSVDNRGTDARGQAFRKSTYMQLGKYETIDQIEAAKYLGKQAYVDSTRIGIFGWSFGGYLSSLCLAKGADVFKMAIAVAPVINWKWYDTIYTERFMRTPKENNDGYEQNSPINFAHLIKGKYLLVHGMADDNVHFQNAAEMAKALIERNIPFDEAYYPNKNHGIYGGYTRSHLYNRMTNFVLENL